MGHQWAFTNVTRPYNTLLTSKGSIYASHVEKKIYFLLRMTLKYDMGIIKAPLNVAATLWCCGMAVVGQRADISHGAGRVDVNSQMCFISFWQFYSLLIVRQILMPETYLIVMAICFKMVYLIPIIRSRFTSTHFSAVFYKCLVS